MSGKSKIEWAEKVWNPVTGCTKVSPGCAHCYAERMAYRLAHIEGSGYGNGVDSPCPDGAFDVKTWPERLDQPLRWKKPSKIFVCSMGDLFHDDVPDSFLDKVFAMLTKCTQHKFLILTKRPERMRNYIIKSMFDEDCNYDGLYEELDNLRIPDATPLGDNVWLGVTAENQEMADKRIPILLQIPAAIRFVSVEPMLGPVNLTFNIPEAEDINNDGYGVIAIDALDWVICGGESGPGARPMHPDWARDLRDQCRAPNVPFFFKQWGEYCAPSQMPEQTYQAWEHYHGTENSWEENDPRWRVGKKQAGRLLDGRAWDEYPISNY